MVADRGKKSKVADRTEEEDSDHIDSELVLSIEKLQEVQDDLEKVNEEASEKVLEVEQKYNKIRRPVYVKRNEIIKSIPAFWLTAFLSHPALGDLLSEEDSKNFKPNPYFEDIKLMKTFTFFDEGTTKITGTNIKWKEGMVIKKAWVLQTEVVMRRKETKDRLLTRASLVGSVRLNRKILRRGFMMRWQR